MPDAHWQWNTWQGFLKTGTFGWWTTAQPVVSITKYIPPASPVTTIGIQAGTASLVHIEYNSATSAAIAFTQTIFDTTTRADSARILLTNSTGVTGILRGAAIRGKIVTMLSGTEGYLNDKYVDYESINANGEQKIEVGNNFIVTIDQVNKLADYYWKNNKTKRHIYTLTLTGALTYFEPGEWYTVTIGTVGTAEYISSVCECYAVRSSLSSNDAGYTDIAFREIYQNWKFDSNETARSIASGQFNRFPESNMVLVAASSYIGTANYYCDGTNDDVEINSALTYIAGLGGGTVKLTEGIFSITNIIIWSQSNIVLMGSGPGTTISTDAATDTLNCVGAIGTHFTGCGIRDLRFVKPRRFLIKYSDSFSMSSVIFQGAFIATADDLVRVESCISVVFAANIFDAQLASSSNTTACIYLLGTTNSVVANNIFKSFRSTVIQATCAIGIDSSSNAIISNNSIYDFSIAATSYGCTGIIVGCNYSSVIGNRVEAMKNSVTSSSGFGIIITNGATSNIVTNNYCYNNGTDTGIANTNGCNFGDSGTDTQYAG